MRWLIALAVVLSAALIACDGGNGESDIRETVEGFFQALSDDPPKAYTYLAEECKQSIDFVQFAAGLSLLEGFLGESELEVKDLEIVDQEEDEIGAEFELVLISEDEEIPLSLGVAEEGTRRFVREDGRWRFDAPTCAGLGTQEQFEEEAEAVPVPTPPIEAPLEAAVEAEAEGGPSLPGEYVDLPAIYGGPYPDTADHVQEEVDYSEQGLPPVGGPHWGSAACTDDPSASPPFCGPVPPGFYGAGAGAWNAESLVHNLEHAGVVVWFNTTNEEIVADLRDFAEENGPGGSGFNVTAFFPEMAEETVAVTAWSRRLTMPVSAYDRDRLQRFLNAHECRFDPERFC